MKHEHSPIIDTRTRTEEFPGKRSLLDTIGGKGRNRLISDTGWIRVGVTDDEDPDFEISPPFLNGWGNVGGTNSPPMSFYLSDSGEVRMRGNITGGDLGTVVFVLPEGFRPHYTERFTVPADDLGNTSLIEVSPNGDVSVLA